MDYYLPSKEDLDQARIQYEMNEPRDLFYRVAIELIDLAITNSTSLTITESISVLLQTWNSAYYRFRKFDNKHYEEIDSLINENLEILLKYRELSIQLFRHSDEDEISTLFKRFDQVLGPVGASKALHLFAPFFFPIWDRAIAKSYGIYLRNRGNNSQEYIGFLKITRNQVKNLGEKVKGNPLKAIDEFNYCKFTKGWT